MTGAGPARTSGYTCGSRMIGTPSPSIEVGDLHEISDEEACVLVDRRLGAPSTWPEGLIPWRLGRDSQSDWKAEVGHWLHTAEKHGFAEPLVARARASGGRVHKQPRGQRHANEKAHQAMTSELAPAMATHYFVGTGWQFGAWEPKTALGDVDVELVTPSGLRAVLQVKAPDQPDQHNNERVRNALDKGRKQLEGARQPSMIVVSAQRNFSLAVDPDLSLLALVGMSHQIDGMIVYPRDELGCFSLPAWRHIGAVVFLDHVRGAARFRYVCTALLNPWADSSVRCEREWYPRARVLWGDGERLHWQAGPPHGPVYESAKIVTAWWRESRRAAPA